MRAVRSLTKVYDIAEEFGPISTVETYGHHLFVGTGDGYLLDVLVENLPFCKSAALDAQPVLQSPRNSSSSAKPTFCSVVAPREVPERERDVVCSETPSDPSVITTPINYRRLSETGQAVDCIYYVQSESYVLVLCEHKLLALDAQTLHTMQNIASSIHTFVVSQQGLDAVGRSATERLLHASDMHGSNRDALSDHAGDLYARCESKTCTIVTAEHGGRSIRTLLCTLMQGKPCSTPPVVAKEVQAPECVLTMVAYRDVVCIGMAHGYAILSLLDGTLRNLLSLDGTCSPFAALGDGAEVYLRCRYSVFTTSMRGAAGACQPLGSTIPLAEDAQHLRVYHPFLFAFSEAHCDVFSLCDDAMSERLPLPGCVASSAWETDGGSHLCVASISTVWRATLHSLRHLLGDLVRRFRVDEAFQLLAARRASLPADYSEMERDVHLMAGYAYLRRCRPKDALRHFGEHIDPRELLLSIPECLPPETQSYSTELKGLLIRAQQRVRTGLHPMADDANRWRTCVIGESERWRAEWACDRVVPSVSEDDDSVLSSQVSDSFWVDWKGPHSHFYSMSELTQAWAATFQTFPLLPSSFTVRSDPSERREEGVASPVLRQVPGLGAVSSSAFLEHCWDALKDELTVYLSSRLVHTSTLFARAMEYALLILSLERGDSRLSYRLITCSAALQVQDCYDVLAALREYRLLACLLYRHKYFDEAQNLLRSRVYVSSYLTDVSSVRNVMEAASRYRGEVGLNDGDGCHTKPSELRKQLLQEASRAWWETLDAEGPPVRRLPVLGRALVLLAQSSREAVASEILRTHIPSITRRRKDSEEESDGDECLWRYAWLKEAIEAQIDVAATSCGAHIAVCRDAPKRSNEAGALQSPVVEGVSVVVSATFPLHGSIGVILDGQLAPSSFAEVFFLLDRMDLPALEQRLGEDRHDVLCCDEEGNSLLHCAFGALCLLESSSTSGCVEGLGARDSIDEIASLGRRAFDFQGPSDRDSGLLHLVLAAVSLLIDAGCCTRIINELGMSCLDVAALPCEGVYLNVAVSCLLACKEVTRTCAKAACVK